MAKMVTRSIITYEYTFVKTEQKGGKLEIVGTAKAVFPEKMGSRKMKQYMDEQPELAGYIVGGYEEKATTYGMSLETFLANSKPINNNKEDN